MRFSFSFTASFPYTCPSLFKWDFACLSLEISIQLFFFPFLFPIYCSVDNYSVSAVTGRYTFFFSLFMLSFESLYWCIRAIFATGESSSFFFSWHVSSIYVISDVRHYASSLVFLSSVLFVWILSPSILLLLLLLVIWNHIIPWKLFALDRNTWSHIIVGKQMIIIK